MAIPRISRTKRGNMAFKLDPTLVRLSPHFLLSDFMGSHSIYTRGLKNHFIDPSGSKFKEGKHLCESLLEPLLDMYGPASVAYGYISPEVSVDTVSYQDPTRPSYHRWDKGAAADLCFHHAITELSPVALAHDIDLDMDYSRMITYSESPFLCLSTQLDEGHKARKAFYENRYQGVKGGKPLFVKKSATSVGRAKQAAELDLPHGWEGAGYPTYHGGGRKQFQHHRISDFSVLSDYLYSTRAITEGIPNVPNMHKVADLFEQAGRVYDSLLTELDIPRLSIVRAFESHRVNTDPRYSWREHFAIDFIPPDYLTASDIAHAAQGMPDVCTVAVTNGGYNEARIYGWPRGSK